jgi:transposase
MQRRTRTEEFKHEAAKLTRQPDPGEVAIARGIGIDPNLLTRWCQEQETTRSSISRGLLMSRKGGAIQLFTSSKMV